jgi:hypothetical protein
LTISLTPTGNCFRRFVTPCHGGRSVLSQNPSSVLPRTTLYFDAARYLETCKLIYEAGASFCSSGFQASAGKLDSLAYYLLLDGPVLPLNQKTTMLRQMPP